MPFTPWVGPRRIAIVPVLDRQVDREPPSDWEYQVRVRIFYDPEPGTGLDRSFQHYLQANSYGRAWLEGDVFPRVWSDGPEVSIPAMNSLPFGHGYTNLLAILPHGAGQHRGGHAFGGLSPVNGITGWARVAMFNDPVTGTRQPIGVWGQELCHLLCNLWEHPGLPGFDFMDGDGAMRSVHASATTKTVFGWLPSGILDHDDGPLTTTLQAIGTVQPPPPGRVTAVRVPSETPGNRLFVEARLRTDPFDGRLPKDGVIVYEVKGESTVTLLTQPLGPGESFTRPEERLQVTVGDRLADAVAVTVRKAIRPVVDRSGQYGAPAAAGAPSAVVNPGLGVHNIIYRDTSGRVHELWRDANGGTGTSNLTGLAAAPTAAGDPFTYVDGSDSSEVVLYRSSDGHVHSLYWTLGPVGHDNLTGAVNATPAAGDPMGWYFQAQNLHHVAYRASNGHIQVLWWQGQGSVGHDDATALASAPTAAGDPCGFVDPVRGDHIVAYRSGDGHIRSLYWAGGPVGHDDLSGFSGTANAAGDPIAFYTQHDDAHQVIYRGVDGHIWEIFWQGTNVAAGWDLTASAVAPLAASDPTAYYSAATNTKRVVYRSADHRIHELAWQPGGGTPVHTDLTALLGAPGAEDRPTAFTVESANTHHVAYRGSDGHIHELRRQLIRQLVPLPEVPVLVLG